MLYANRVWISYGILDSIPFVPKQHAKIFKPRQKLSLYQYALE